MLVVFRYNNGKESQMQKRYADILERLKHGTQRAIGAAIVENSAIKNIDELDQLRAEAEQKGIEYHHRAGLAKLRELLGK